MQACPDALRRSRRKICCEERRETGPAKPNATLRPGAQAGEQAGKWMRHFPLGGVESAAKKELSGFAKTWEVLS
jgi:hypothetical protein